MTDSVIELRNIGKTYRADGVEVNALKSVDLQIQKGEYLSITGPSGGGKSTLLSLIGLLDSPTDGQYLIEGIDTSKLNAEQLAELRNQHLGFVFQSFNLVDELTLKENVALPLTYRENPKMAADEIESRVTSALQQVGLGERMKHRPNQLSGGQQQRVAIARAIACKPSIMLLDEPTGNLDSENAENIMNLISDLNSQGMTICMVTHEPKFARCAARQVFLLDGQIQSDKKTETEAFQKAVGA